jgi:hypothetical protein
LPHISPVVVTNPIALGESGKKLCHVGAAAPVTRFEKNIEFTLPATVNGNAAAVRQHDDSVYFLHMGARRRWQWEKPKYENGAT